MQSMAQWACRKGTGFRLDAFRPERLTSFQNRQTFGAGSQHRAPQRWLASPHDVSPRSPKESRDWSKHPEASLWLAKDRSGGIGAGGEERHALRQLLPPLRPLLYVRQRGCRAPRLKCCRARSGGAGGGEGGRGKREAFWKGLKHHPPTNLRIEPLKPDIWVCLSCWVAVGSSRLFLFQVAEAWTREEGAALRLYPRSIGCPLRLSLFDNDMPVVFITCQLTILTI